MKIIGWNRHGGKSTSDIIIQTSDFCVISIFCDAVLQLYKGRDYCENSGADKSVKIAEALKNLTNPMNDKPAHFIDTDTL